MTWHGEVSALFRAQSVQTGVIFRKQSSVCRVIANKLTEPSGIRYMAQLPLKLKASESKPTFSSTFVGSGVHLVLGCLQTIIACEIVEDFPDSLQNKLKGQHKVGPSPRTRFSAMKYSLLNSVAYLSGTRHSRQCSINLCLVSGSASFPTTTYSSYPVHPPLANYVAI